MLRHHVLAELIDPLFLSLAFFDTQWQKKEISIIFLPLLGVMLDHRDIFLAQQSLHWFLLPFAVGYQGENDNACNRVCVEK